MNNHPTNGTGNQLDRQRATKTVLLTTYKRDGTPVDTPVSVAFDGERLLDRLQRRVERLAEQLQRSLGLIGAARQQPRD
jgi:hypothetical protein